MKRTSSLSKVSCLSEYTRLYTVSRWHASAEGFKSETTFRDRVLLKIDPDTCVMDKKMFDQFQGAKIVEHFKTMAPLGYGYTQQEYVDVAIM